MINVPDNNPVKQKYEDDIMDHLSEDIDKARSKYRMYISFSNELAAKAIVLEILYNALDECRNPRSPANKIMIEYDERIDTIKISDNGRGIPSDKLELLFTTLNSGSNINSGNKSSLEINTLGRNGAGTLIVAALGERAEVITHRGGTENIIKRIVFHEGKKIHEEDKVCDESVHGMTVVFKPSKVLGRDTRIVWDQIREELVNLQFLNTKKVKMTSLYINSDGVETVEKYTNQEFVSILSYKNGKDSMGSDAIHINFEDRNIIEDIGSQKYKRFISVDIGFAYIKEQVPYIDSFCNGNNTIDNGSHLEGVLEAICRHFQQVTKNTLTERDKLDIKWEDVKNGLSFVVSLNTNMEEIFTSQTKHKVHNNDLEKHIRDKTIESLQEYFKTQPRQLKDIINIIKINARSRREGDKARNSVVKETMTNWSAFLSPNYDPCTNRGKEYKELYIIEGLSAKGSLKTPRDPRFQALFAIRGVPANVFKLDMDGILKNKEFNDLIKILGCNVGIKFDINKLQFDKIIIASDADKLQCPQ